MTLTKNIFSPESGSGSFIYAIALHGLVYGAVIALVGLSFFKTEHTEIISDLTMESFDAPPEPAKEVHHVMKSAEPVAPIQPKDLVDNSPKEMQDEKSEIAGTQKAVPVQPNIGSTDTGTVANTPYYKIKPKYPRAALVSGLEGWVMLLIDIKEDGEVDNIRVVDGEQRNMFQAEARRAVAQWKYKPFVDQSGKAFRKADHQVRVDFKLKEEQETAVN